MGGVGVLKIGKFSATQIQYTTAITIEINIMGGGYSYANTGPQATTLLPPFFSDYANLHSLKQNAINNVELPLIGLSHADKIILLS